MEKKPKKVPEERPQFPRRLFMPMRPNKSPTSRILIDEMRDVLPSPQNVI